MNEMKKINVVIEVEEKATGLVANFEVDTLREIESCVDNYIELFNSLPPVGLHMSFADCAPVVVNSVDFSTYEKCAFIYFTTL